MKRVVILTADELRHDYFKLKFSLDKDVEVLKTYCDITKKRYPSGEIDYTDLDQVHFSSRHQTEKDFFQECVSSFEDKSNSKYITRGDVNLDSCVDEIRDLNPDYIVTYGCCIIKPRLLQLFKNRIINVHLGLSPYYFGAGTNFHPFVNNELAAVGCTYMYMNEGIDTGEIIHQIRASVDSCDSIHQVGNRLIKEMTSEFIELIKGFDLVKKIPPVSDKVGKTYKMKDCTLETIVQAYENIESGICVEYLKNKGNLDAALPLVQQDFLC